MSSCSICSRQIFEMKAQITNVKMLVMEKLPKFKYGRTAVAMQISQFPACWCYVLPSAGDCMNETANLLLWQFIRWSPFITLSNYRILLNKPTSKVVVRYRIVRYGRCGVCGVCGVCGQGILRCKCGIVNWKYV
jgi:hypothetical protein